MKAVILAGGLGTRLAEETGVRPKPMIEIGGFPVLWHIMKGYARWGITDFVVCLGFKGYLVKEYFANYFLHQSDVTIDLARNAIEVLQHRAEPWRVTLVDTGEDSGTGGRIGRIRSHVAGDDAFCLTYGDGLSDVDVTAVIELHRRSGVLCTVTAAQPPGRFGALGIEGHLVTRFMEKPAGDGGWINAGFFVCSPKVCDYIDGDDAVWEQEPLQRLASERQLAVYQHRGFWQPMDTLRDKLLLEKLWQTGAAPWKTW